MMRKRSAVSSFIATLLLIIVVVSAGVLVYSYTMGYIGGFSGPEQIGTIITDESRGNSTCIIAHVRNIGDIRINITTVYVDGEKACLYNVTQWGEGKEAGWVDLSEGMVAEVYIDLDDNAEDMDFVSGRNYDVKLVASDNTQTGFSVKPE
jgi:FlaG/FlaF family flagellin (archaellin)